MENPSFYDVFERMWQHVLTKLNSFVTNENFNETLENIQTEKEVYVQNSEPVNVPDDTIWIDLEESGKSTTESVLYTKQNLTEDQQAQARANIGAVGDEVTDLSSQITLNYPNNCRFQLRSCYCYGKMCTFTVQLFVDTAITGQNYGFTLVNMPVTSKHRVWISNGTQFYMDSGNSAIKVNNSSLSAGNYILSGFFITN